MAAKKASISKDLGIETDRTTYRPGDTVSGVIYRANTIVSTEATIDLVFHGRSKSYIDYRSGDVTYTYKGEFALFRQEKQIFQGPLHIPSKDRQQWPFSFTIPTNIDARLYPGEYSPKLSYIPLDSDSVAKRELPASFSVSNGGAKGTIEYLLEATLKSEGQGSSSTEKAVLPIRLINVDPNPPISDFDFEITSHADTVCSQRLVPGKENAELSTSDKMKKFFGTSSVPVLAFNLQVQVPKVVQLSDSPIPVYMRVIPNWSDTSESIRNAPQKAKLASFRASLKYEFDVVGSDSGDPYTDYASEKVELLNDEVGNDAVEIPCTTGDKPPPADIGSAIRLRLGDKALPNVSTFNIKTTTQKLSWKATCKIANESFSASGSNEVTILPASIDSPPSWMAPPDDDVPPPSFADVQRQDEKKGFSVTSSEYPKEKQ
uniref:Arrestin-like N-terminal domain-containing protein n=1 Tax=Bionectria ochroleuca TaxID=29856 RepID=A0A8H7N1S3_BIOOC